MLSSRSRSQRGLIWSNYDCFHCIFWTANPFATKLGFMEFCYQPECPVDKKGLLCLRLRSQWNFKLSMNVCLDEIFWTAEPFITNLGTVMHHHDPECNAKGCFTVIKIKVTVKAYVIEIWLSAVSSELLILLQPDFRLTVHYISWVVLWKDCIPVLCLVSRLQQGFKISWHFHLDHIFWDAKPFVTMLGMVMHHHGLECPAKRLVCSR